MIFSVNLLRDKIFNLSAEDVNRRIQLLALTPEAFDIAGVVEGDEVEFSRNMEVVIRKELASLNPYLIGIDFTPADNVLLTFEIADNFNPMHQVTLEELLYSIVAKMLAANWFMSKNRNDVAEVLIAAMNLERDKVITILYEWRISRTARVYQPVHVGSYEIDGKKRSHFMMIETPAAVIASAIETINTALKLRAPNTFEYLKVNASAIQEVQFEGNFDRAVGELSDKLDAYVKDFSTRITGVELNALTLDIFNIITGLPPAQTFTYILLDMPEMWKSQNAIVVKHKMTSYIIYYLAGQYFQDKGLGELAQTHEILARNEVQDLLSLLHRRTSPIRRGSTILT